MFSEIIDLVLGLAAVAFLIIRWRRLKRERREFLEKRYRLQGLSASDCEKLE
jgi:hypothetical protein